MQITHNPSTQLGNTQTQEPYVSLPKTIFLGTVSQPSQLPNSIILLIVCSLLPYHQCTLCGEVDISYAVVQQQHQERGVEGVVPGFLLLSGSSTNSTTRIGTLKEKNGLVQPKAPNEARFSSSCCVSMPRPGERRV